MMNSRQFFYALRMLCSDRSILFGDYLKLFEETEIKNYRPNEGSGKFHCVYERRLHESGHIDGGNGTISVNDILSPSEDYVQEKQLLCINATPGYGKEFFAKRICMMEYDITYAERQEDGALSKPLPDKGRVPFIIKCADIEKYHEMKSLITSKAYNELCWLCVISINRVLCENQENWEKYSLLSEGFPGRSLAKKIFNILKVLLDTGRLFVLFEKDTIDYIKEIGDIVNRNMVAPKDIEGTQKNLLVFIFDNEQQNPFADGFYNVTLSALSKDEVMDHIKFCANGNSEVIEEFKNLFGKLPALTVPDCLLFITETHISNIVNIGSINMAESAAELYDDCIRAAIRDRVEADEQKEAFNLLRGYAWSIYRHPETKMSDMKLEKFQFCEGKTNHLLKRNGEFRFEGCKEYLIASNIYNRLPNETESEWDQMLLHEANDNIIKRLIEISAQRYKNRNERIYNEAVTERIWAYLVSDSKDMTVDKEDCLLCFMEYIEDRRDVGEDQKDYLEEFINQIVIWLSRQEYDTGIFDFISRANKKLSSLKINRQLKRKYINNIKEHQVDPSHASYEDKMRFIRRYLFYVGIHSVMTEEIIEGTLEADLCLHEKYHLMRALLDNIIRPESKDPITNKLDAIENCDDAQCDAILKSGIMVLRWRLYDETIGSDKEKEMINALRGKLQDSEYWVRAHAADALGHFTQLCIPGILCRSLSAELKREEDDYTKLKVVNYFVEAVCEFFHSRRLTYAKQSSNERRFMRNAAQNMLGTIQGIRFDQPDRREMNISVCVSISEGVLYIIREDYSDGPKLMRKHVDDVLERWSNNTRQIIKTLEERGESGGSDASVNIAKQISDKISDLKEEIIHMPETSVKVSELTAAEVKRENKAVNYFINSEYTQIITENGRGVQHNISKKGDNDG